MATTTPVSLFSFMFLMIMQSEGQNGWMTNLNYTGWSKDLKLYPNDLLEFIYDVNRFNFIQVNKDGYEEKVIHDWSTGTGVYFVPLKEKGSCYFITSKGFCYEGTKLRVEVLDRPSPPSSGSSKISAITSSVPLLMVISVMFWLEHVICNNRLE